MQINEFIDELAVANSDFITTLSIGKSYEGRDMRVIQITKAGVGKPNIWIEGGNNFFCEMTLRQLVIIFIVRVMYIDCSPWSHASS